MRPRRAVVARSLAWRRGAAAIGLTLAGVMVAGFAAAGLAAGPATATDWSKARLVTVVTVDDRFEPDHLAFRQGVAYHLHLDNRGKEMHEFTAPAFFKAVAVRDPAPLDSDRTEIVLQPGQSQDVYFVPQRPGRYKLICADHDWDGMTGDITID